MALLDVRRISASLLGGLALTACPDRPIGGDTDTTDTDRTSTSSTNTTSSDAPTTDTTSSGVTTTGDPWPPEEAGPQLTPWDVVVDAVPFPIADIHTLTVGRREYEENFANRGIVEILFDHPEETITIEARKYLFDDLLDIEEKFGRLSLWAYVLNGNPTRHPDPADDCRTITWKDGCGVFAYYDGKSQPARSGMDLRVHLPTGWRGQLFVATEDNDAEPSWPRRGDVKIDGLCSSGQVDLEAGRAEIRMCRDLSPAPTCPPDSAAACATWPDGTGSEAWSPDCPCSPDLFGQLRIRAPQPWAADIVVDVPDDVWLSAALQSTEISKPHQCMPQIDDCEPDSCVLDSADEYAPTAEFNDPGPAAPAGAGFNVTAVSGGCTLVPFVEPDAPWTPGQEPLEEPRGHVRLCTDCLL